MLTLLFSETDRVQRMGTSLGFLLLDIDHFSKVNLQHRVLTEFSDRIRRFLRSYDLVGRVGYDEFLIALPGCASNQALQLAARLRTDMLLTPFAAGDDTISITVSIGTAQSRGRSPLVVLHEAECALAEAKRGGRNCEKAYTPPLQTLQSVSL